MEEESVSSILSLIKEERDGDKAIDILNISSYFAPDNIPVKLFLSLFDNGKLLKAAIKLLRLHSLIDNGTTTDIFAISRSVQKIIQASFKETDKKKVLKKAASLLLEYKIDTSNVYHAINIWKHLSKYQELVINFNELPNLVMKQLIEQGKYGEADTFGTKELNLLKRVIGINHSQTTALQYIFGILLGINGKYKEALNALKSIRNSDIKFSDHKEIRLTLASIAKEKWEKLSKGEEAQEIYKVLLYNQEISNETDGPTVNIWCDLAFLLVDIDEFERALEILREILLKSESLRIDKESILSVKWAIANALFKQNEFSEALQGFKEVYKGRKILLRDDHPDILRVKRDMASTYSYLGFYEKAIKIFEEIIPKFKKIYGEKHLATLSSQTYLALTFQFKREHQKALEIYEYVNEIKKKVYGPWHLETLKGQHNVATALRDMGKYDRALKIFQDLYEKFSSILGTNHRRTLKIKNEIEMLSISGDLLLYAVKSNSFIEVEKAIKNGAVVNSRDSNGFTPLHFAVSNGNKFIVRILLKSGADITQVTGKGNSPLHMAVLKNYKEIVDELLMHVKGENFDNLTEFLNAGTIKERTAAIHVAARKGLLNIVISLLQYGAIYNIENKDGQTPFQMSKDKSVADFLEFVDGLFQNLTKRKSEIITKLKASKPDEVIAAVNARDKQGNSLLQVLVINKDYTIANELLTIIKQSHQ